MYAIYFQNPFEGSTSSENNGTSQQVMDSRALAGWEKCPLLFFFFANCIRHVSCASFSARSFKVRAHARSHTLPADI